MTRETVSKEIASAECQGTSFTDIEGMEALLGEWVSRDRRRTWEQDGAEDAVLAISYWDDGQCRQVVTVTRFDTDADEAVGYGWSLFGLPFDVELPAAPTTDGAPMTLADLDGSDDEADWLQAGHVLDGHEVEYLRTLHLPPTTGEG